MKTELLGRLVLFGLKKLAKYTDNKIDDKIVSIVEEALTVVSVNK